MDRDSNFSSLLSKAVDTLGYSFQAIQRRVDIYNQFNEHMNANKNEYDGEDSVSYILAGSKREGISISLESDYDYIIVFDDIKCTNKAPGNQFTSDFKLIQDDVPNGYTMLQLQSDSDFLECIVYDPMRKNNFLSSKLIIGTLNNASERFEYSPFDVFENKDPAGPSLPMKTTSTLFNGLDFEDDFVTAFPCIHSDYIIAFCSRDRHHGFPSRELLHEISQMEGQVVPVGQKGSDDQDLQWRICYTLAEIKLIQSFNAAQYQLYIVLKMLAKQVLKPVCSDITSYVMKNIVLWIIEVTPKEYSRTETLSKLIVRSMLFLKILVSEKYIPNYMIPVRNLLAGKILPSTKNELIENLSCLLDRGESMVFKCPELEKEMIAIFNSPNIYRPRLEERNSYIDLIAQLWVNSSKFVFQNFESVKAFTDEIIKCIPMARIAKIPANIPGWVENSASLLNKPLVVETRQQILCTPENINSMKECIRSNASQSAVFMTPLVAKTTELLYSNPELMQKIMPSDESLRILTTLLADVKVSNETNKPNQSLELLLSNPEFLTSLMTPEWVYKIQQHLLPYAHKMISENPQMMNDSIRLETQTNFALELGEDNMKLLLDACLRSMDVEDGQRIVNYPGFQEYLHKMLKGHSM